MQPRPTGERHAPPPSRADINPACQPALPACLPAFAHTSACHPTADVWNPQDSDSLKACKAGWLRTLLDGVGQQPRLAACLASTELLAGLPTASEAVSLLAFMFSSNCPPVPAPVLP